MYFRQSKQFDLTKNRKTAAVIETTSQEFAVQKKFLQKNVKKCDKIESSLNIMFKKYKEKSAE
jgi:hypothetical protein